MWVDGSLKRDFGNAPSFSGLGEESWKRVWELADGKNAENFVDIRHLIEKIWKF